MKANLQIKKTFSCTLYTDNDVPTCDRTFVAEVHWVAVRELAVHAGNTAAAPASEAKDIIRSPTNMAAADGGVISRYASHC